MFKILAVLVMVALSVYVLNAISAADGADLKVAAPTATIHKCTLAKISTASASKCQSASYSSLSADERSGIDHALSLLGGGGTSPACQVFVSGSVNGWTCASGSQVCTCVHDNVGPMCGCTK